MPPNDRVRRFQSGLHLLFTRLEPSLVSLYRQLSQAPAPNLWGDRDIEHSWIAANIPVGPGRGLDFGSGDTHLSLVAVRRGFRMTVCDRNPIRWPFEHPDFMFVQSDALELSLPQNSLDLIVNCSTIEHLGLGRYGDAHDSAADLDGMRRLRELLNTTGVMLLTVPVGQDRVYQYLHRIYGRVRLPLLLEGYAVQEREYWTKNAANRWALASEDAALDWVSTDYVYALGCFVLSRTDTKPTG